jgi:hypothetical protein
MRTAFLPSEPMQRDQLSQAQDRVRLGRSLLDVNAPLRSSNTGGVVTKKGLRRWAQLTASACEKRSRSARWR